MAATTAQAADMDYLVRKSAGRGYRWFSLLTPPAYAAFVLSQKGRSAFSMNRLLRTTWAGGVVGAIGLGGFEYIRSANAGPESIRTRRLQHAYDTAELRADDHSTIGGLLFAVLTPAIFWNKAKAIHLILGGAGLGSGIGLLIHYGRTLSGDPPPRIVIPTFPVPSASE